jgi:divalent metal cation (Fe/Co/Zn/Cd) transporter
MGTATSDIGERGLSPSRSEEARARRILKVRRFVSDRSVLAQQGKRLEYFTIGWNSLEGLIAVTAGAVAGSISLVGFGIDSFIEVTSGSALLWRMSMDADVHRREQTERRSLRIVGVCFLGLAAYVAYEAIRTLILREAPAHSPTGIALACVSLVVMPLLSRAKRRVGRAMCSAAMQADARQTEFCTYLSAILLGGLLMNMLWGLWWADPIAALVMVPIIAKEGIDGLSGDTCCN